MYPRLIDYALSSNKSDIKTNIGKYFWKQFYLAHFSLALQVAANLMLEMPFYLRLKFLVKKEDVS